jgi:hypothetical protein
MIRKLFHVRVRSCDLSEEACKRARELFQVEAESVDGVSLPYPDGSFDVVLSSESLEHIPQYGLVLKELLRVAKKAVVVTVPHDGPAAVADNIRKKVPHGHIHDFTLASLRELAGSSCETRSWGLYSSVLRLPYRLVEGRPIPLGSRGGVKRLLVMLLNPVVVLAGRFLNKRAFKALLRIDPWFAHDLGTYRQALFIIAKDRSCWSKSGDTSVEVDAVLDFKVPLHSLEQHV